MYFKKSYYWQWPLHPSMAMSPSHFNGNGALPLQWRWATIPLAMAMGHHSWPIAVSHHLQCQWGHPPSPKAMVGFTLPWQWALLSL